MPRKLKSVLTGGDFNELTRQVVFYCSRSWSIFTASVAADIGCFLTTSRLQLESVDQVNEWQMAQRQQRRFFTVPLDDNALDLCICAG